MSGVKGRSGRKRKNPLPQEVPTVHFENTAKCDPLAYLLAVVADERQNTAMRVRAAVAAAQYTNVKLHEGGKKELRKDAAELVLAGKFGQATAPKLVVNNS
jgi:hypothetical protein